MMALGMALGGMAVAAAGFVLLWIDPPWLERLLADPSPSRDDATEVQP
ncbi:hypothetical protein [Blastococcus sp. CCUG 61487]|nr:hypothetical protein [Blastococcus sp. CCUG 61487]